MREFNNTYRSEAQKENKVVHYTLEFDISGDGTSLVYFTSDAYAKYPTAATFYSNVLNAPKLSTQSLNLFSRISSIGDSTLILMDNQRFISTIFSNALVGGKGQANHKLVLYKGYNDIDWAYYEPIRTLILQDYYWDDGLLYITGKEQAYLIKKKIFQRVSFYPTASVTASATTIYVTDTTEAEYIEHGTSYDDQPALGGTCSVTNGDATVTSTGKSWLTTCYAGDRISINSVNYTILSITNNNELELTTTYAGTTGSESFVIYPKVVYLKWENEIIRCPNGGITATSFSNVKRGAMNTKAVKHDVSGATTNEQKGQIEYYSYIQMPAPKLALALITGAIYGQSSELLPSFMNGDVDPIYVDIPSFYNISTDLYDVNDDTKGLILRFEDEPEQDLKNFLEEQVLLDTYIVNSTLGELKLVRQEGYFDGTADIYLDEDKILNYLTLKHNNSQLINNVRVNYRYSAFLKKYRKSLLLTDTASISAYYDAPEKVYNYKGLGYGTQNDATAKRIADLQREMFAGPPITFSVDVPIEFVEHLEPGNNAKIKIDNVTDDKDASLSLNRLFLITQIDTDEENGIGKLSLFGSTARPSALDYSNKTTVLPDSFYTGTGVPAHWTMTNIAGLGTYTDHGSYGSISATTSLTGTDANGNTTARYVWYLDKELRIDSGVTLFGSKNVTLLVKGEIINNGTINGFGAGYAGRVYNSANQYDTAEGTWETITFNSDPIGVSPTPGGILRIVGDGTFYPGYHGIVQSSTYENGLQSVTRRAIKWENSELKGLPSGMMGMPGGAGGGYLLKTSDAIPLQVNAGESGGNGGASFTFICRGFTNNGLIKTSGNDGTIQSIKQDEAIGSSHWYFYNGGGAGGNPGGLYFILDGKDANVPVLSAAEFEAYVGDTAYANDVTQIAVNKTKWVNDAAGTVYSANYPFSTGVNKWQSMYQVSFIDDASTLEDYDTETKPISPTTLAATSGYIKMGDGTVAVKATLTWTASTDKYGDYYILYYKKSTDSVYLVGQSNIPRDETTAVIFPLEVANYDFKLVLINAWGQEADDLELLSESITGKSDVPNSPTALAVKEMADGRLKITWTNPADLDLAYLKIYVNDTNNWGTATELTTIGIVGVGSGSQTVFTSGAIAKNQFYWCAVIDTSGNESTKYPNTTAGILGTYDYTYNIGKTYNFEEYFDNLTPSWVLYNIDPDSYPLIYDVTTNANSGAKVLRINTSDLLGGPGPLSIWNKYTIPFHPSLTYKTLIVARKTGSSTYTPQLNVGFAALDENFNYIEFSGDATDYDLANHLHTAYAQTLTTSWQTFTGFTKGFGDNTERVTNGDFSSATGWTYTGWTYSGTNMSHNTGNTNSLSSSTSASVSSYYTITFTISSYTTGTLNLLLGTNDLGDIAANGTFSAYGQFTGNATIYFTPSSDFDGTIDDISVKELGDLTDWGSSGTPNVMHPNTRYIQPFIALNYPDDANYPKETEIDSFIVIASF